MNIKQSILFALILLLAACRSDDKGGKSRRNSVRFAAKETITRADARSVSDDYHLYISALWHDGQKTTQFKNTPILELTRPTNEAPYWGTGWYWPPSGYMNFIAWGANCEIEKEWVSFTYTGGATLPASLEKTFQTVSIDLRNRMDGTTDIIYLNELDKSLCTNQTTAHSLLFNHATSSFSVALHAYDALTAANLGIYGVKLDNVPTSGILTINVGNPDSDYKKVSLNTPSWSDKQRTNDITLSTFTASPTNPIFLPAPGATPNALQQDQPLIVIPGGTDANLTVNYTINGSPHAFIFPFTRLKKTDGTQEEWIPGKHHIYRFTVTLKEIQAGAMEEQWDTEIGGSAFEPEWSVEISTGAAEATWGVEIGGQAYEVTWNIEMSATALETVWITEAQASASENNWKSEIGSSANENNWNTEAGASASESNWNTEAGASASESNWNTEAGASASESNWNTEAGASASESDWNPETGGSAYEEEWQPGGEVRVG